MSGLEACFAIEHDRRDERLRVASSMQQNEVCWKCSILGNDDDVATEHLGPSDLIETRLLVGRAVPQPVAPLGILRFVVSSSLHVLEQVFQRRPQQDENEGKYLALPILRRPREDHEARNEEEVDVGHALELIDERFRQPRQRRELGRPDLVWPASASVVEAHRSDDAVPASFVEREHPLVVPQDHGRALHDLGHARDIQHLGPALGDGRRVHLAPARARAAGGRGPAGLPRARGADGKVGEATLQHAMGHLALFRRWRALVLVQLLQGCSRDDLCGRRGALQDADFLDRPVLVLEIRLNDLLRI
mmetsp:Transcript_146940/g.471728  ORF Transcript_146940/g.471728 Transcript_146940/m.471728 type:complete len:305 (+) Transcript_146940:2951-3865(+)